MSRVYMAARYDKGTADYINCPFTREEYDRFYDALISAQSVDGHEWEKLNYFESCLPIEEIGRRGRDTLRFGPMKPVGLRDPRTGQTPYAVVQLRQENLRADSYNIVGFQNHLKFGDQAQVLRLVPGLENARFLRYRPDPSQHLHQLARAAYGNAADEAASECFVRWSDFRSGRLCGINCHRLDRRHHRGCSRQRNLSHISTARFCFRIADPLHHACRCARLPACEHHLRSAACVGAKDPRQEGAASSSVRTRVARVRRMARTTIHHTDTKAHRVQQLGLRILMSISA